MKLFLRNYKYLIFFIILILLLLFAIIEILADSSGKFYNKKFVGLFYEKNYEGATTYLDKALAISSSNAIYHANKGLLIYSTLNSNLDVNSYASEKAYPLPYNTSEKKIEQAINEYRIALNLNPNDDCFWHNLSWLYIFQGKKALSKLCINNAIQISPETYLYYITAGIFQEHDESIIVALQYYEKAIILSPDLLESKFIMELKKREPLKFDSLLNRIINKLELSINKNYSPITKARLGKLYINKGFISKASTLIFEVTSELPNLPRPWYYLGIIKKGSSISDAKHYLQKAITLNPNDALIQYERGKISQQENDTANTIFFYKRAMLNIASAKTENSFIWNQYYGINCPANNIIPQNLIMNSTPQLPIKAIATHLSEYYRHKQNSKMEYLYKNIAKDSSLIASLINSK